MTDLLQFAADTVRLQARVARDTTLDTARVVIKRPPPGYIGFGVFLDGAWIASSPVLDTARAYARDLCEREGLVGFVVDVRPKRLDGSVISGEVEAERT